MTTAKFHEHKVAPEGLYIRGLSGPVMTPDVEIFVEREDAEMFGWVDPTDGVQDDATQELQQQTDTIQRNLTDAKLLLSVLFKDDALSEVYAHICDSLETLGELRRALNLSPEVSEEA